MSESILQNITVPLSRIFLDLKNPRHEPYEKQADVIEYLCKNESIYTLANDIVKTGLNPLERFALIPSDTDNNASQATYIVAEGNRRLCALKLLHDPELAPPELRKSFAKLSEGWSEIKEVPATVFTTREDVKLWLERIHSGLQGGIGRKEWNAEQKTRFSGDRKNITAQAVLDYAVKKKFLSDDDRKRKLTTAQRYLSNPLFRDALGIEKATIEGISRNRPENEFDLALKKFINDLQEGKEVNSRSKKEQVEAYAQTLRSVNGLTNTRVSPEPVITTNSKSNGRVTIPKPPKPQRLQHIKYEEDIFNALQSLGNTKLDSIYHSICTIGLEAHTPLLCIAVWSFFEALTANMGRNEDTSFDAYFSSQHLGLYNLGTKTNIKTVKDCLERISKGGNTTKHHFISVILNGPQLANDMETLKPLILQCIEKIKNKTP